MKEQEIESRDLGRKKKRGYGGEINMPVFAGLCACARKTEWEGIQVTGKGAQWDSVDIQPWMGS